MIFKNLLSQTTIQGWLLHELQLLAGHLRQYNQLKHLLTQILSKYNKSKSDDQHLFMDDDDVLSSIPWLPRKMG